MKYLAIFSAFILPKLVFAQTAVFRFGGAGNVNKVSGGLNRISDINGLASRFLYIGDLVIYVLVSFGVLFIVYNIVWYFIRPKGGEGRGDAGLNILWGIIGLAIIVSIWGLVNLFINTFYTDTNVDPSRFPNANFINNQSGMIQSP